MTLTLLLGALTACGGNSQAQTTSDTQAAETQIAAEAETAAEEAVSEASAEEAAAAEEPTEEAEAVTEEAPAEHAEVLVAYFSATGTTKGVAERIAAVTGGDLYEILAAEPYSDADLNYNDSSSRSTKEQNDKSARPEIGSEDISLDGYTTVYLGFPIWWGE
ncbi:MAG: flavodoxin, partial [Lachnospiraceae bacterium]|nr:flavodoxin [Lachnospiraceae bacterium]